MVKELKLVGDVLTTVTTQRIVKMFIPVMFKVDIWASNEGNSGWNSVKIAGNDNEMQDFWEEKYVTMPYLLRETLDSASRRCQNSMTITEEIDISCLVDLKTKQIFWIEQKMDFSANDYKKRFAYEVYHEITQFVPSECLQYAIDENFVFA